MRILRNCIENFVLVFRNSKILIISYNPSISVSYCILFLDLLVQSSNFIYFVKWEENQLKITWTEMELDMKKIHKKDVEHSSENT